MRANFCGLFIILAAVLTACAASPPPRIVSLNDLAEAGPLQPGQALVVELHRGDRVPLDFTVEGPLVRTASSAPIELEVVRPFFLRIDDRGLATSLDGRSFGANREPGAFRVGVSATKETGLRATFAIRTPVPREP